MHTACPTCWLFSLAEKKGAHITCLLCYCVKQLKMSKVEKLNNYMLPNLILMCCFALSSIPKLLEVSFVNLNSFNMGLETKIKGQLMSVI